MFQILEMILSVKQLIVQCYDVSVDLLFLLSNKILCNFFQVSVQKQLSQYFRNQRISKPCKSSESGGGVEPKPYKKARLASSAGDDDIAQRRNLERLSSTEEDSPSAKTFSNLVKESYPMRRKFITEEAQFSFSLTCVPTLENQYMLVNNQGPVFQRVDSAIHWINHCLVDNSTGFNSSYLLDSGLYSVLQ